MIYWEIVIKVKLSNEFPNNRKFATTIRNSWEFVSVKGKDYFKYNKSSSKAASFCDKPKLSTVK